MSIRFKLSPELVDGQHWTPVDTTEQVLESIKFWCDEMKKYPGVGQRITIEIVDMSDEEIEALPDI